MNNLLCHVVRLLEKNIWIKKSHGGQKEGLRIRRQAISREKTQNPRQLVSHWVEEKDGRLEARTQRKGVGGGKSVAL